MSKIAAVAALALAAAACSPRAQGAGRPVLVTRAGLSMGSALRVSAWTSDAEAAGVAFDAVFREFERLDGILSVWRDGSDARRINAAAGIEPVKVGPDTLAVLEAARQISDWTGGKFDVTFGALADVWKFDQDQDDTVPDRAAILRRLPLVDYRAVEVNGESGTVFLKRRGMRVHFGGIGKGYAVGRAAAILRAAGLRDFMIQAGGDLYAGGTRGGQPWRLGIADPRDPERTFARVELTDSTFSTSGDYERFFFKGGRRYHHLIDPQIGEPARGCRSVTIVADSPMLADGLSTGVFILGPAAGLALVERLPQVEAVIVTAGNEVLVSSGLRSRFTLLRPPTDAP